MPLAVPGNITLSLVFQALHWLLRASLVVYIHLYPLTCYQIAETIKWSLFPSNSFWNHTLKLCHSIVAATLTPLVAGPLQSRFLLKGSYFWNKLHRRILEKYVSTLSGSFGFFWARTSKTEAENSREIKNFCMRIAPFESKTWGFTHLFYFFFFFAYMYGLPEKNSDTDLWFFIGSDRSERALNAIFWKRFLMNIRCSY